MLLSGSFHSPSCLVLILSEEYAILKIWKLIVFSTTQLPMNKAQIEALFYMQYNDLLLYNDYYRDAFVLPFSSLNAMAMA